MNQGHGVAGHYGGLSDPYEIAKIVLLPVPFDKTSTYQKGSDKGPAALIEASRNMELYDIETDSEIYKKGIFTAPPILAESSEAMLSKTHHNVKEYLENGKFVVTLGGEHTIAYAAIKAHVEHFKTLTILHFDAHADLQGTYENNPWSHACVMARVRELEGIVKIISIGIRSMSVEEKAAVDVANTYFSHQVLDYDAILANLAGPIYITLDLDVFDSGIMPSTGTPEPGGLDWYQVTKLLKRVGEEKEIVGFDLMELCPQPQNPAPDYLAAKLVYKILSYSCATL